MLMSVYRIFWCITLYFLLLERPGAGYITNAGYTLLKSEFFVIMDKFLLPYIAPKCVVFPVLHGPEPSGNSIYWRQVEKASTGGRWPLHTYPTLTVSRHSVIRALHQ